MKRTTNLLIGFAIAMAFTACSKEEEQIIPLFADFELSVTGTAPTAVVSIENKSTGATGFTWSFGLGADVESSQLENPEPVNVDKAGMFTVTLVVSDGSKEETKEVNIEIAGNSAIITYTDVELGNTQNVNTVGRFFSTETGMVYKDNEVNSTNGPQIDLALVLFPSSVWGVFVSPNDPNENFGIPGATATVIKNLVQSSEFDINTFDSMNNDSILSTLQFTSNNSVVPMDEDRVIFFRNSKGKTGIIKTKALNASCLLVDIKVEKY